MKLLLGVCGALPAGEGAHGKPEKVTGHSYWLRALRLLAVIASIGVVGDCPSSRVVRVQVMSRKYLFRPAIIGATARSSSH